MHSLEGKLNKSRLKLRVSNARCFSGIGRKYLQVHTVTYQVQQHEVRRAPQTLSSNLPDAMDLAEWRSTNSSSPRLRNLNSRCQEYCTTLRGPNASCTHGKILSVSKLFTSAMQPSDSYTETQTRRIACAAYIVRMDRKTILHSKGYKVSIDIKH